MPRSEGSSSDFGLIAFEHRRIEDFTHGLTQDGEHRPESRVKQQRLLIAHEEVIELHVEIRHVDGEAEYVRGDFVDGGHGGAVKGQRSIVNGEIKHP